MGARQRKYEELSLWLSSSLLFAHKAQKQILRGVRRTREGKSAKESLQKGAGIGPDVQS